MKHLSLLAESWVLGSNTVARVLNNIRSTRRSWAVADEYSTGGIGDSVVEGCRAGDLFIRLISKNILREMIRPETSQAYLTEVQTERVVSISNQIDRVSVLAKRAGRGVVVSLLVGIPLVEAGVCLRSEPHVGDVVDVGHSKGVCTSNQSQDIATVLNGIVLVVEDVLAVEGIASVLMEVLRHAGDIGRLRLRRSWVPSVAVSVGIVIVGRLIEPGIL